MRLTRFTDLGLRARVRMAGAPGRAFSTAELADELQVSRHHLTKTVAALSAAGVVETRRGSGGGAVLAQPAASLRIGDLVAVLEHGAALVECVQPDGGACTIKADCRLKGMLFDAQRAVLCDLNRHTLADCALSPAPEV